jgi:hypothetical protein
MRESCEEQFRLREETGRALEEMMDANRGLKRDSEALRGIMDQWQRQQLQDGQLAQHQARLSAQLTVKD